MCTVVASLPPLILEFSCLSRTHLFPIFLSRTDLLELLGVYVAVSVSVEDLEGLADLGGLRGSENASSIASQAAA